MQNALYDSNGYGESYAEALKYLNPTRDEPEPPAPLPFFRRGA